MPSNAGIAAISKGRRDLYMLDPAQLRPLPGLNARDFDAPENVAHVAFLRESIRADGRVKVPLTVRLEDAAVLIVDGECRWRAVTALIAEGMDFADGVPCIAELRGTSELQRRYDLITRNTGKPFMPMELAVLLKAQVEAGEEQQEIARKLGMSPSNVSHLLSLLEMPEPVQEMVRQGNVAAKPALDLVRSEGGEAAAEILTEAVAEAKAEAPATLPLHPDHAEPAKPRRVTNKKIEEVKDRKKSAAPDYKPKPIGKSLPPVMVERVLNFLGKIITGKYDDDEETLQRDAEKLSYDCLEAMNK